MVFGGPLLSALRSTLLLLHAGIVLLLTMACVATQQVRAARTPFGPVALSSCTPRVSAGATSVQALAMTIMSAFRASQMPHLGMFRGDTPELVEALIQASRIPIVAKNAIPSLVGRELVPWQPDDAVPANARMQDALESGRRQLSSSPKKPKYGARNNNGARISDGTGRSGSSRCADSYSNRPSAGGQCAGFACPALANSPRPEALPKPTANLLNRAGSRSRSPSPGRDDTMYFRIAQPFVSPVAA